MQLLSEPGRPADGARRITAMAGGWTLTGGPGSIRTRLTLLLILVVTLVYGVFAVIEIEKQSARLEAELRGHVDSLLDFQADALAIPLWNFDRNEIRRQLQLFAANPDIAAASVEAAGNFGFERITVTVDDNAAELARILGDRRPDLASPPRRAPDLRRDGAIDVLERVITNEGEVLGRLIVEVTHSRIAAMRADVITAHLRQFLIITAAVALTIAAAVTGLVRPILSITQAMENIAGGDLDLAVPATDRDDEIGKMARALGVFKANAVQLKAALDKERELSGMQRQFVSMVSHEFRTPLAIIDGNAQRLQRRKTELCPDKLGAVVGKIRMSVVRLTELMESILSSARLEDGQIAFSPGDCDLAGLLREICSGFRDLDSGHRIIDRIDRAMPPSISADAKLLRQIFSNLLSNAVKYAPAGTSIRVTAHPGEREHVVVSVRDEGVGIPEDEIEKLFERFFRASTSTGIPGTGIGLHLVRHLVLLHGGSIEVDSSPGEGTTFSVRLPISRPAAHRSAITA